MLIISISVFLFSTYACLIIYYRQSWLQIPMGNRQQAIGNGQPATGNDYNTLISVIIPARNEENNIKACLESVLAQEYPADLFEVIVVDDFSTDHTVAFVSSFPNKNLSLISLQHFTEGAKLNSYKKKAIEIAISKSKGELIVTTDADCVVPVTWLKTIAAFYQKYHPVCIAAPVAFLSSSKGERLGVRFLKIFQSLDFMTLQGITGAAVYKKFHNMCNGANFSYEKKVFYEVGGFTGIDNIASGDDMLLMHKISERYPQGILFLKSTDAIVQTRPADTVKEFLNQRIRWASKADKYTDKKMTAILVLVYLLNAWIFLTGILTFFYPWLFLWWLALLLAKTIVEIFFLYPVARFFKREKLLWWFPVAQPLHILYTILAGWLGKFGTYKWKERKVK